MELHRRRQRLMKVDMGFVVPTVLFAGVLVVAVLILWTATFATRGMRRGRQVTPPSVKPTAPWLLPHEPALPGIAGDEAQFGDLAIRAASIIGPASRETEPGQPRQDAYRLARDPVGQHAIIAVADGATAPGRPGLGANMATNALVSDLRQRLERGTPLEELTAIDVFAAVAQSMVEGAQVRGIPISSLYTTLVAMIVPSRPRRDGRRVAWLGYLGSSSAWLNLGTGWQRLTSEDAPHALLPFQPDHANAVLVELPTRAVVAIATDGLADAFTHVPGLQRHFARNWQSPSPIASFLLDVDLPEGIPGAQGFRDDRTAVVVWCGAA